MKTATIFLLAGMVLATGCVYTPEYYRVYADRLALRGDLSLQRDPHRYGPVVVYRYSCFLSRLPRGPEFEPVRRMIEEKRARAQRLVGEGGSTRRSDEVVFELGWKPSDGDAPGGGRFSRQPRILCRAPASAPGYRTKIDLECDLSFHAEIESVPCGGRESSVVERAPCPPRSRGYAPRPMPRRTGYGAPPAPPKPKTRLSLDLGASTLDGKLDRDGASDLFGSMGSLRHQCHLRRYAVSPALGLRTRLGGNGSRLTLNWEMKGAIFEGKARPDKPFSFGDRAYGTSDDLRTRITVFSTALYFGVSPSRRFGDRFQLLLGMKYTGIHARLSSRPTGTDTEAFHIPTLCVGLRFHTRIGRGFRLAGTFRPNFLIWTRKSSPANAIGLDAGVRAFIRLSDRAELCLGCAWEGVSYKLELSEDRDKKAVLMGESYFAGIRASF